MDISDSLSTNNSELDDTMGSILSTSNENETQHEENDLSANITSEESSLISQNIEVNELQNTTESEILPDTTLDNVESYTETLSEQDINLIIMGKPSTNDDSEEVISSSVKDNLLNVASTSHIEEHEELWLGDNTRQLVKVDTDEDFEVIVKSLETAIVETERYDIDTVITSNDETVMSSVTSNLENSLGMSLIEPDGDSLLEDIPSNLLTSAVPPLPLQELQGDVRVELSGRILQSPVERPVLQHRDSDNYDEFATISEPKVESFDEQSSSLFDVMEPEIDIPIANEPSLLELQEATLPADISEGFQKDIETRADPLFSRSADTIENIIAKADELEEICEASVDSEFAENQFNEEQIESDISNEECSEETEESLKTVIDKIDVENLTKRKNEITITTFSKFDALENETRSINEASDSDENVINVETSQLKNIFENNADTVDIKGNIVTSPQLEIKAGANNDTTNIKNTNLIIPQLLLESTSKSDMETEELLNSTINVENQLEQELNVGVKFDIKLSEEQECADKSEQSNIQENIVQNLQINSKSEIPEKQKYVESNEFEKNVMESDVQEKQDNESQLDETITNIESKNISSEESSDKSAEKNNIQISLEVCNKTEITESTQTNIKNKEDKIDDTKEIQKETVSLEEIQKESFSLKETRTYTSTSSSGSIKHRLDDEKEQSPPKKIKLVREKFQRKPQYIESQQLPKNVETSIESEMKIIKQEEKISSKTENEIMALDKNIENNPKTVQISKQKSVESKETIQQILEKLEDPLDKSLNENKSPVKAQKLKLQRNYKLPQKSAKQKLTTKILEESINTSAKKKVVEEIKITNLAQDKSVILSSKEEIKEISQLSLSKTKDTALETKISVVSIELNEPAVNKDETKPKVETKSVEPHQEIEVYDSVPTYEISVSTDNAKIIDAVTGNVQQTLFSMQQVIPETIEDKNPIDNQTNLEEVQETNTVTVSKDMKDLTEEISETENKDVDNQMVHQLEQKTDFSQTLINMKTQFSKLKTEESSLSKNEILIFKADTEKEQIINIGSESIEIKIQQPDLIEIEVEEKKEESYIENEILDSHNITQEATKPSDDNIGIETTSGHQNTAILKNIENITCVVTEIISETMDMSETVIDENLENIDMGNEKIKEPKISEETEQFFSSSNTESNVKNIAEIEIASIQTNMKKENISEVINVEEKIEIDKQLDSLQVEICDSKHIEVNLDTKNISEKIKIQNNIDTQEVEMKIENTKHAQTKLDTTNKEEKIEIENTKHVAPKIDPKNKEEKIEIEKNLDKQKMEMKIENTKQVEAKIDTKNIAEKIKIQQNFYTQEAEMKVENTKHVEVKIDTKNMAEKIKIQQNFYTQEAEMKVENTKHAETKISTKNKEEKIEIDKNLDTLEIDIQVENTKHVAPKIDPKNNEEKIEIGKNLDKQKVEMKIENTKQVESKIDTKCKEEKMKIEKNFDTQKVDMKIENTKYVEAKIDTTNKEDKIEKNFATHQVEKKIENTKHVETKIDAKDKKGKIKIEKNFDAQKDEMKKIENTKHAGAKIDTKNKDAKIEKMFGSQKIEMKIENRDISDTKHTETKIKTLNIADIHKSEETTGTKSIVNIENPKEKINTYKALELNLESYGMQSAPKIEKLLTINTQFPLLSSRLQERLEPKSRKFTQDVKITPIIFPTVSQESVSKKIQEQLNENKLITGNITISKQDLLPVSTAELSKTEATAILAKNPAITLTKEIPSSRTDHSATMESATKIKITKRKLDTSGSETIIKRSVTKPLSVQIDDLENSNTFIERSHSSGTPGQREQESIPKFVIKTISKSEGRASPKITIKPIKPPEETSHKSRTSEESSHSPKITIKPIIKQDPLKITITKQKADDTHSILKIYQPDDSHDHHIPKLTIKPISKSEEMQHSPRITIKPVKPSPSTSSMSPKITVKPIPSPSEQVEIIHSPKITVKPVINPEDSYPKVTIKPVLRPEESHKVSQLSPRQIKLKSMTFESSSGVTVEPICGAGNLLSPQKLNPENQTTSLKISVKPFAKMEESLSPKLTIKPITKTCEIVQSEDGTSNPLKLTIKPILKPEESSYQSPKITIKPIVKPDEMNQQGGEELDKPERIILKIQKTSLPSPKERLKDAKKEPEIKIEAIPQDPEKSQRLDKIKLKLTKEGSHAQIIPSISTITDGSFSLKRSLGLTDSGVFEKRSKTEFSGTEILHTSDISINIVEPNAKPCPKTISEEVTIMKIDKVASGSRAPTSEHQISQSKFKEMLMKIQQKPDITCTPHIEAEPDYSSSSDDVKIVEIMESDPLKDPLSLNDESNSQDVMIVNEVINTNPFQNIQIISAQSSTDSNLQTPKKRGRPRKNPLEVKPEIKGEDCIEVRPKRTCRAPPGRTPFAVKERKPRGAGRGRGSRGRGASKSPQKSPKEVKTPRGKALKEAKALAKIEAARLAQEVVIDEITIEDSTNDTPAATPVPPVEDSPKKPEVKESEPPSQMVEPEVKVSISEELPKQPPPPAVYEEETRMSAENNSRAQTPARQVFTAPLVEGPEESQSSVQSTATTESSKIKKGRLEVCDPDSAVTTVDQIVEYSWANGGPYMLQEQIAQYLGVKSFKRKYPGLTRRPVEMQERDYIREKGLVSESMCDMGLTAVPSSEILDIMYSDFQEKYEEYRKCLRDKQAKEISNKQKAVSLATSQEKNKIDFKERAIRSAANWNLNFNKARKETRKCCMDLQTFTINYPAGKKKVPYKTPVGHYPLALVPGQYTDYYKSYTTNDLHYLPLNTVRYGPVLPNQHCDAGQSDGSQTDSDSSSGSDSDSSDDSMSTEEETPTAIICKTATVQLTQLITTPKSKVH